MSPWLVLACLAATCAAQHNINDCSVVAVGDECEPGENPFELETEYLCREATRVVLHWSPKNKSIHIFGSEDFGYYIVTAYTVKGNKLKKSEWGETEPNMPYKNFYNLTPNTTYKFGIVVKTNYSDKPVEIITTVPYTTLAKNYDRLPEVTHSNITDPVLSGDGLRTTFSWTPVPENVCSYEIVVINRNGSTDLHPLHIISRPHELRKVEVTKLRFGTFVSIGVYATIENESEGSAGHREGKPFWTTFKMPECHEFHGWNYNICIPESPHDVIASVRECNLDLKWAPSLDPPPWYQILVYPLDPTRNGTIKTVIEGVFHHFEAPTHTMGDRIEIRIAAHSLAGSSVPVNVQVQNECTPEEAAKPYGPRPHRHEESSSPVLLVLIVILLFVIIILLGSFGCYKVYMSRKVGAPQPLRNQESCEMTQPLSRNKSRMDAQSSADASSTEDADMAF